jgi:hypothetical protein
MFNVIFRAMFYNDGNIFSLGNTLAFVVGLSWSMLTIMFRPLVPRG